MPIFIKMCKKQRWSKTEGHFVWHKTEGHLQDIQVLYSLSEIPKSESFSGADMTCGKFQKSQLHSLHWHYHFF